MRQKIKNVFGWVCSICGHYNNKGDLACGNCGASK